MSSTWSGPLHEHDHSILTTFQVEIGGKVASWADYRTCVCGHRVHAALTAIPVPRSGDNPYADDAQMPLPLQRLRGPLALEADQKANGKHLGSRLGPNGDRRKLRSWLSRGAIPLAQLAALLFTAELCLIQSSRVRRAAGPWRGGKSRRAVEDSRSARSGPNVRPPLAGMRGA